MKLPGDPRAPVLRRARRKGVLMISLLLGPVFFFLSFKASYGRLKGSSELLEVRKLCGT